MGKIVRVVLNDGRTYVGRMECIDRDCNLYVSACFEIVDNESPINFDYKVFNTKGKKAQHEYRFTGHIIVPKPFIKQILEDTALSAKFPEDSSPLVKEQVLEIK